MKMKVVVLSGRGADAHVVHSNDLSRPFFVIPATYQPHRYENQWIFTAYHAWKGKPS